MTTPTLELRSLVKHTGELELSLVEVPTPTPTADDVVVRVEAAPLNPSDLGVLFAGADLRTAKLSGSPARPIVTAQLSAPVLAAMAARVDRSTPVGNEGAGTVIAAGSSAAAQALLGKTVAILTGGGCYAQVRTAHVAQCMELPAGRTAIDGASAFVNPLTALAMVETMRREGHSALVHTAAASNLGQMLNRVCLEDGVALVNIVRKPAQVEALRALGAKYVCDSSSPAFATELADALAATGATLAFDAIGGGPLVSQILTAMEKVAATSMKAYSLYGSTTHKQVYIYGRLDPSATTLTRNYGMAWGIGGWLVFPYLMKLGGDRMRELKARVAGALTTTFASTYTKRIALADVLRLEEIAAYARAATGEKFLVLPNG